MKPSKPRESGGRLDRGKGDLGQPGRGRRRTRGTKQKRIRGEPRTRFGKGRAQGEMPPEVVGENRLAGGHDDRERNRSKARVNEKARGLARETLAQQPEKRLIYSGTSRKRRATPARKLQGFCR